MGGDNSPDKTNEGIGIFLKKHNYKDDVLFNIFGDEVKIKEKIKKYNVSRSKSCKYNSH